ncbi:putative pantothenate transporter [Xylariales sp. PMI_506]|nr:putative pantothenate transporter [Xylariales sp. PMI_506]
MDDKPFVTTAEQDKAAELFGGHARDFVYSAKEEARVRWKLDLILLPIMVMVYVMNFMDKVALSEASIFGIATDLHLVGQMYSWSSSIFYLGYFVFQYPSSVLMQKFPIGRYFGCMVFLWGLTALTTIYTKDFKTLCINRVFLGVFETCMSPILTILVGQYWTREEQPLRASIWWAGGAVGSFLADSITYGVSSEAYANSNYHAWQLIYLVFGPITMVLGIIVFFTVPTSPMQAWFLTEKERKVATARVLANQTGVRNTTYKMHQVIECLRDPQPWILALHAFLQSIQGGGLTSFSKIVLTGFGFSSRQATLMSLPSDTIHLLSVVFAGWFCSRFRNSRCLVGVATNVIVLVGAILVDTLPSSMANSRLGAFYVIYVNTVPFALGMSMLSSNIAGFTKKSTASVMMFIGYCVGQFSGPQFFIASEAPRYNTAFKTFFVSVALMIFFELLLMGYLIWQNRKRDRLQAEAGGYTQEDDGLLDLTDWEQPGFRYIW